MAGRKYWQSDDKRPAYGEEWEQVAPGGIAHRRRAGCSIALSVVVTLAILGVLGYFLVPAVRSAESQAIGSAAGWLASVDRVGRATFGPTYDAALGFVGHVANVVVQALSWPVGIVRRAFQEVIGPMLPVR